MSHRVQTTRLVQIVEVRQATLLLVMVKISDNYFASAYHRCRFLGLCYPDIFFICNAGRVVVRTDGELDMGHLAPDGQGRVLDVAGIKGHRHGQARGLVHAGPGGVALHHQNHLARQGVLIRQHCHGPPFSDSPSRTIWPRPC